MLKRFTGDFETLCVAMDMSLQSVRKTIASNVCGQTVVAELFLLESSKTREETANLIGKLALRAQYVTLICCHRTK
jgi:hypothetical protein